MGPGLWEWRGGGGGGGGEASHTNLMLRTKKRYASLPFSPQDPFLELPLNKMEGDDDMMSFKHPFTVEYATIGLLQLNLRLCI